MNPRLYALSQKGLSVLDPLRPRKKLLTDFYVFDVETKVTRKEFEEQQKAFNSNITIDNNRVTNDTIYWGLKSRPENFVFGVIYGYNYTKICHSLEELTQELLTSRFKNKKVFAHNAVYDLTTSYGNIFKMDNNALFNGSRFISCTNGVCKFADSMNIFVGQSVKTIGIQLGIPKEELGENLISYKGVGSDEINYCIRDCRIIWDALYNSFTFANNIKITQASLSLEYFRNTHLKMPIEHNTLTQKFFDSYYGGRCEAFKMGKTNAVVYDVNSMYPDRMRNEVFPNPKNFKQDEHISISGLSSLLSNYEGMLYAKVSHRENWLGLLPVKHNNKLVFPTGVFSGCWNFNEFRSALPYVEVLSVEKVIYAERMESPFTSYVDKLFELKFIAEQTGDEFWRDLYKRYANSLYGKLAQKIDEETIYIENIDKDYGIITESQKNGTFIKLILFNVERNDAFLIKKSHKNISKAYQIPALASYITSGARVVLNKKMLECEKNKVVYCDTDSIFVENDFGMVSSKELGGWKLEDKIITHIYGLKNYRYVKEDKEFRKLKGVPNKATKISESEYEFHNLVKTKESLVRNMDAGTLIKRKKIISGRYDKRIVFADGETKPITL